MEKADKPLLEVAIEEPSVDKACRRLNTQSYEVGLILPHSLHRLCGRSQSGALACFFQRGKGIHKHLFKH